MGVRDQDREMEGHGEITTLSGVTAQNAMETMGPPVARLESVPGRLGSDPVLRWLRQMRSDLFFAASSARAPNSTSRPRRRCFYMGTRRILGYLRQISFGSVAYVDSIGPVACMERHGMRVGRNQTLSSGYGQNTLGLVTRIEPLTRLARRAP